MLVPSLLYCAVTILLALTDAVRIKVRWNKVKNINHGVSRILAVVTGMGVLGWWVVDCGLSFHWLPVLAVVMVGIGFIGIRLALYDLALNILRNWTGTNPSGKIDYVSSATNDYEDQHSEKVPFWAKRIGGFMGWLLLFLAYKVIFKV